MNNWINAHFQLAENKTNIKTEVIAGITTFLAMAYILAVLPNMMGSAGFDRGTMLTCLTFLIILTTAAMGLYANKPFALASGLGGLGIISSMVLNDGVSTQIAAGMLFVSALLSIIFSFSSLRKAIITAIPVSLKYAITAGIGLFIALIGAKSCGLVIALEAKKNLAFGDLTQPSVILCTIGFLLILVFKAKRMKANLILSILITTAIGIPMGLTKIPATIFSLPAGFGNQFLSIDILGALNPKYFPFIIALFIPDFFSTVGAFIGVGSQAGMLDKDGNMPGIEKCFYVDSIATLVGSLFGVPSVTTYLESSSGVEAGGRTGLTVVVTAGLFVLAFFISPVLLMIPYAATAPVVMYAGINMLGGMKNINYSDFTEYIPAFLCIAFTIFSNNIANGICIAIPSYLILKIFSGKLKEVSVSLWITAIISILYFYIIIAL